MKIFLLSFIWIITIASTPAYANAEVAQGIINNIEGTKLVVESKVVNGATILTAYNPGPEGSAIRKMSMYIPGVCQKIWYHPKADSVICESALRQYQMSVEEIL